MSALEKAAQESKRVHVLREKKKTQIESTAMAHLVETCIVSLHIFLPYSIHDLCLSLSLNSVRKINIHRIFQYTENLPEGYLLVCHIGECKSLASILNITDLG